MRKIEPLSQAGYHGGNIADAEELALAFRSPDDHGHLQLSGGLGHCLQCNEVRDIEVTDRKVLTPGVAQCLAQSYHVVPRALISSLRLEIVGRPM